MLGHTWGQAHRAPAACSGVYLDTTPCPSCSMCLYCFQQHKLGILIIDRERGGFYQHTSRRTELTHVSCHNVYAGGGFRTWVTFTPDFLFTKFPSEICWTAAMEIIPSDNASATILTWLRLKNKTGEFRGKVIHLEV